MKKIFLTLVGAVVLMGNAVAQQWDANNFMARVGLNFGNVAMDDFSTDAKVGFHLAGVYERQLFATTPLFLETGLALTQKGYKLEMGGESSKSNMWYLEVPVMVNYKFAVNEEWTLYPSAGIYYATSHLLQGSKDAFVQKALETIGIAGVIAVGILMVSTFVRLQSTIKKKA